jgi:5-methylcytosine-specific restriction protein A
MRPRDLAVAAVALVSAAGAWVGLTSFRRARKDGRSGRGIRGPNLRAEDIRAELARQLGEAKRGGYRWLRMRASVLHEAAGGSSGSDHRMPLCCRVMKQEMQGDDKIVEGPPSGQGPSLTIDYWLPRRRRSGIPPTRRKAAARAHRRPTTR